MTHSIDEARRGVEQSWSGVLAVAETEQRRLSLWEFETKLWFLMLALGRALVGLFLARQAARPSAAEYPHEGQRYQRAEVRTSEVGTRFGKVSPRGGPGRGSCAGGGGSATRSGARTLQWLQSRGGNGARQAVRADGLCRGAGAVQGHL